MKLVINLNLKADPGEPIEEFTVDAILQSINSQLKDKLKARDLQQPTDIIIKMNAGAPLPGETIVDLPKKVRVPLYARGTRNAFLDVTKDSVVRSRSGKAFNK